jgi:outer membrane protein
MSDEYDKQRLILSDEKKREREAQMQSKYDALDSFTKSVFGPGGLSEQKYNMLMKPLLEKISKAIEAVALRDGYDVIFTLSSIGYIKDSYDVTDKVLAYLEENE